jgi:hypothetical protein
MNAMKEDKIGNYFRHHVDRLNAEANQIANLFSEHRPSSGANKEAAIRSFFESHLPANVGVGSGLVASKEEIKYEQDLILFDKHSMPPLYGDNQKSVFLIETIFALIEVKSNFSKSEIIAFLQKIS